MQSLWSSSHIGECPAYQKNSDNLAHSKVINIDGKKFVFCTRCIGYHQTEG